MLEQKTPNPNSLQLVEFEQFEVPEEMTDHSDSDNDRWKIVIDEEMTSFHQNKTWKLIPLPKEKKATRCKWVNARKEGTSGIHNIA